MGKISDYTVGTMKTSDLITVSDGETLETKNLTVSQIQGSPFTYGIYTALLTQTGTAAPVATVVGENTIGTIVWTRAGAGEYIGTLAGAFNENSTVILLGANGLSEEASYVSYVNDADTIHLRSYWFNTAGPSFVLQDEWLLNTFIEIRNY